MSQRVSTINNNNQQFVQAKIAKRISQASQMSEEQRLWQKFNSQKQRINEELAARQNKMEEEERLR
jgi:hypothetical protein